MTNIPLPRGFADEMTLLLGADEAAELIHTITQTPPSVSIRLHAAKGMSPLIGRVLPFSEYFNAPYERVPWNPFYGIYLPERPVFTADPLFHGAAYYVQEASSMALALIRPLLGDKPLTALDLCAAPGGKSTLLADILPPGSALLANEIICSRATILAENMRKWGRPGVICSTAEPQHLAEAGLGFDLILCDVPCSGEGMFRKDPESRAEWSPSAVEQCADRAQDILDAAWQMLRPGGLLVFSTCTYNRRENEDNVSYLLAKDGALPVDIATLSLPEEVAQATSHPIDSALEAASLRFMPHRTRGEGLFMALVRKSPDAAPIAERIPKSKKKELSSEPPVPTMVRHWLKDPDAYHFRTMSDGYVHAIPLEALPLLDNLLAHRVRLVMAGVDIGQLKGRNYIPAAALPMNLAFDRDAFESRDLCREEAILYLRRDAISVPPDTNRGFLVVTYANLPLGFIKHLGTRANNLYPREWRIRMELNS